MFTSAIHVRYLFAIISGSLLIGGLLPSSSRAAGPQAGIALAYAPQAGVYTVWEEGEESNRAVYLSCKSDDGRLIGFPVRVNVRPEDVGTALGRGPRLAVNGKGGVAVLWEARAVKGAAPPPLRLSFSRNGGKTFLPSVPLPTGPARGAQDLGDVALGPDGTVHAVWLQNEAKSGLHFWYARSVAGKPFSPAVILDRVACECCQTSVAAGPDGKTVAVAWRDNVNNVRDIKARISRDGGKTFGPALPARNDNWKIDGCPMQGPSVAVGPKGEVAVGWSEAASGTPRVHVARWEGGRFHALEGLPAEAPATHPVVRFGGNGDLWVAWEEKLGPIWADPPANARVRVARAGKDGKFGPAQTAASGRVRFPTLAVVADGAAVGWWEGGGQRGETTVVRTGRVGRVMVSGK
jgi:hypothetical protein